LAEKSASSSDSRPASVNSRSRSPFGFGRSSPREQRAGDAEQLAVKRRAGFEHVVGRRDSRDDLLRGSDAVPCTRGFLQLIAAGDGFAKFVLIRDFFVHDGGIEQAGQFALEGFAAVLNAKQIILGAPRIFLTARAERGEQYVEAVKPRQSFGQTHVAQVFKFRHREQTARTSRMTGDENQIAIFGALLAPFQVVLNLRRLAVLVSAEETDIEVVAWVFEVIRVAAVKSNLLLGREDDADIGVAFEAVKMVAPALIKRHDSRCANRFCLSTLSLSPPSPRVAP
jgi:hypothetical protein